MKLNPYDADYPQTVLELDEPPPLTVSGPLAPRRIVAIVGSRQADVAARDWAHRLAYLLAKAGIVVASGGAVGIDESVHRGALKGGVTWAVACAGQKAPIYPPENRELFAQIEASKGSRIIWPFPDHERKTTETPRFRNSVLVALASYVVVVQAKLVSGSLNAAWWASWLGRPLFVVPGRPWDYSFVGSTSLLINKAASPLYTIEQLFKELDLPEPDMSDPLAGISGTVPRSPPIRNVKKRKQSDLQAPLFSPDSSPQTDAERAVLSVLSPSPTQQDKIVAKTGLGASATLTALLTLSLRDVVVEGPDGFFRSKSGR